jgi:peptide subunit release factor 1 (eRF1)
MPRLTRQGQQTLLILDFLIEQKLHHFLRHINNQLNFLFTRISTLPNMSKISYLMILRSVCRNLIDT